MLYAARLEDFITPDEFIRQSGVGIGGRVQKVIDAAVIKACDPYVPYATGRLARSVHLATTIGSGEITYDTPYARDVYYPASDGGKARHYNTAIHQLAGPYWFDRAMADHGEDILKEARDAAAHR